MAEKICRDNGLDFHFGAIASKITGKDGKVTGVELSDGTHLDADVVIIGAGIQPSTQFVDGGVVLSKDGSVKCDPFLRSSDKDIYAAGDVATFPYA